MAEPTKVGETQTFTTPAKAGKPEAYTPKFNDGGEMIYQPQNNNGATAAPNDDKDKGKNANAGADNPTNNNGEQGKTDPPINTDISDDQLRSWFEKQGIPFETVDSLKTKLTAAPPKELTPEEKEKVESAKNKRLLDEHLSDPKRTVEEFAAIPKILSADKKILGVEKEMRELLADGYTKEAAETTIKERYYQYTDEEINATEDNDEKEQMIKERTLGNKKLERKGEYIQNQVKLHLNNLEQNLAEKDAETVFMGKHTSTVEDAIKKFQRKQTFELGKNVDEKDIPPIDDFEVSETALASAKEVLSDYTGFKNKLLTKEGHVNLDFILPILVNHFSVNEAVKKAYLTSQNRAIAYVKGQFGSNIPVLGSQQNEKGIPGKLVRAGKPEVVR